MRFRGLALAVLLTMSMPAHGQDSARTLTLDFNTDGTVTLEARHVTPRDILAEWARQCGCFIVNADRLTGGAINVPVLFDRESQSVVLRSLLRQAAGYVLTPKRAGDTGPSNYETIYIVPTSAAVSPPSFASERPAFQPSMPTQGAPDDEIPAVAPVTDAKSSGSESSESRQSPVLQPGMSSPAVAIVPVWPSTPAVNSPSSGRVPTGTSAPGTPTPAPPTPSGGASPAPIIPGR